MIDKKYKKKGNKLCGVYSIICLSNKRQYIGSSINIKDRWKRHRRSLMKNAHGNIFLQRAWNKYKPEEFKFKIIELCLPNKRIARELFWIKKLNSKFNLNVPNIDKEGFICSKITRIKMSNAAKGNKNSVGRVLSLETRDKISKAMKGNQHAKGWIPTKEQLHRMSIIAKGRKRSKEFCHNLSIRMKGNKYSNGHIPSEETRRKISRSNSARKLTDKQVLEIQKRSLTGENQSVIAADFEIANSTVSAIKTRRVRRWLWK